MPSKYFSAARGQMKAAISRIRLCSVAYRSAGSGFRGRGLAEVGRKNDSRRLANELRDYQAWAPSSQLGNRPRVVEQIHRPSPQIGERGGGTDP